MTLEQPARRGDVRGGDTRSPGDVAVPANQRLGEGRGFAWPVEKAGARVAGETRDLGRQLDHDGTVVDHGLAQAQVENGQLFLQVGGEEDDD